MDISPGLIEKLKAGDYLAFKEIYNFYYFRLYHFAKKIIDRKEDAEDVVSQTFVTLWKLRASFDSMHNLKAFLFISVKNASIDYYRRQQKEINNKKGLQYVLPTQTYQENEDSSTHDAIREEVLKQVYKEIEDLPAKCKTIFKMAYLEGMKGEEIANILNLSHQTVRNQLVRGLKKLRMNLSLKNFEQGNIVLLFYFLLQLCQSI